MLDLVMTVGAVWAGALAISLAPAVLGAIRLNVAWLLLAAAIFALNTFALFYLKDYIPLVVGELHWNWSGKFAAVLVSLLVVAALWLLFKRPPSAAGFTLKQAPGSLAPALVATVLLLALGLAVQAWTSDGADVDLERLAYQATMPGLDEELFWRGTLLLALNEALRGGRWNLLGAHIGWGGVIMTLMFGVLHGFAVQSGQWLLDPVAVAITGVTGFGLLWIRERTGSVLIPILAHNLINLAISFV